jgi:hypothetical protein
MAQLTLRVDDALAKDIKREAALRSRSMNAWIADVLRVALDPDLADNDLERTRARLARAGLLARPDRPTAPRPDPRKVAAARKAAGKGTPLSQLVSEGRD